MFQEVSHERRVCAQYGYVTQPTENERSSFQFISLDKLLISCVVPFVQFFQPTHLHSLSCFQARSVYPVALSHEREKSKK